MCATVLYARASSQATEKGKIYERRQQEQQQK